MILSFQKKVFLKLIKTLRPINILDSLAVSRSTQFLEKGCLMYGMLISKTIFWSYPLLRWMVVLYLCTHLCQTFAGGPNYMFTIQWVDVIKVLNCSYRSLHSFKIGGPNLARQNLVFSYISICQLLQRFIQIQSLNIIWPNLKVFVQTNWPDTYWLRHFG